MDVKTDPKKLTFHHEKDTIAEALGLTDADFERITDHLDQIKGSEDGIKDSQWLEWGMKLGLNIPEILLLGYIIGRMRGKTDSCPAKRIFGKSC